ncbi:MAG TPA: radical SAM protein [Allosphingosinicella sp.]|jgi:hypothetical protein
MQLDRTRVLQSAAPAAVRKAELLSAGVDVSAEFLRRYGPPFLEKRRAYGNPDPDSVRHLTLPQELILEPDGLVVSVNIRPRSPHKLDWDGGFCIRGESGRIPITFPLRPQFYDYKTPDDLRLSRVITLYGGGALGIFIYGNCALVDMGKACQYCSIAPNRSHDVDFEKVIRPERIEETVFLALKDEAAPISQVMLNGGNFPDPDRSFLYYVEAARAARRAIDRSGRSVDLHLIVFPPRDLELLGELKGTGACVAMNSEVFDPELFARFCPGKEQVAGQGHMAAALRRGAEILGEGAVYSIIVGGLDDLATLSTGMQRLAGWGVTPVINVFHADPGTPMEQHPIPSAGSILEMGRALQEVFQANPRMRPFYLDCGRNSLDTEAYRGLF